MEPTIVTLSGRLQDQAVSLKLGCGEHIAGRAVGCDIPLDEPSVSRRHASLIVTNDTVHVRDLDSSNGTRVAGRLIDGATRLHHADQLQLGNVVLTVELASRDSEVYLDQMDVHESMSVSVDEARSTGGFGVGSEGGRKAHLFRILAEASELLTSPRRPQDIFDPLLSLVEKALDPERVVLLLCEEDSEEPRIVASRVPRDDPGALIISSTLMSRVLSDKQAFLTHDAGQDARLMGGESLMGERVRSAMAAPLFDNEDVIGILYADTGNPLVQYNRDELTAFLLLANVVGVAITHARYHAIEEERQRLVAELDAARLIMSRLLPRSLPETPSVHVAASLLPCDEVAGDLFDARRLPDGRLLIVVGDVSGHGLPAALLVAALLPAIRLAADECGHLGAMTSRINAQLFEATDAVRFATLFLGRLDPETGQLEYVNAGHNPPLLLNEDTVHSLAACGPPVGMMPEMDYSPRTVDLAPGNQLVLFSDGVTEAQRDDESMYGDDRLLDLIRGCGSCPPLELQQRILDDVATFTAGAPRTDDITVMLVQREQGPS